jgi:hypothetical protein
MRLLAPNAGSPRLLVLGAILLLAACGSKKAAENASSSGQVAATSASSPSGPGACGLLTMGEAKAAYPDVAVATPYRDLEKHGIQACDWGPKPAGRTFQARLSQSSVGQELTTYEAGVMDPMKQAKLARIPFGVGGQLMIGRQADTPGALGDIGVAAVQKGPNTIVVATSDVSGDPKGVEKRLADLATAAASRAP